MSQGFHFQTSLASLAEVALRETRATGYAVFQRIADEPGLVRVSASGAEITVRALLDEAQRRVITFPLQNDGLVAFSFRDLAASGRAREPLSGVREAMETIWAARHLDAHYLNLLGRLSTLEAQLIDSKIADRAQGLLSGEPHADVLDALVRHVKTVLRPSSAGRAIETIVKELEDEIEERRVTGQAKAILQATHSISEEEAYTRLRLQSRKSRRRLKEVAMDVIASGALTANAA